MKQVLFEHDRRIVCIRARSFPMGIQEAFIFLDQHARDMRQRACFGISWLNEQGQIIYNAGVEESYAGEAQELGAEIIVLKKGNYLVEELLNWRSKELQIGQTFARLTAQPGIDPGAPCVEWYTNQNDVQCMIRLKD